MNTDLYRNAEAALRAKRIEWERRLSTIQDDRRRVRAPLDPDFEDQAIERENDATLDALDERGRQQLMAVEAALARIVSGAYGQCVACGAKIEEARLSAEPTAASCVRCVERE